MAKLSEHDKTHMRNLAAIRKRMDRIFAEAAKEAARIGVKVKEPLPEERIFSFDDYPATLREVSELVEELRERMEVAIANGVRSAWTLSNDKNNALVSRIFAGRERDLSDEEYRRYFSNNNAALEAFLRRRSQGMNLSDRVWNYSQSFRREIEMGIDLGLRSGESAAQMARSLRQYLREPDKLFRRVRDRHGVLQLSKAAKAYNPGRGVYRSSYKNALRLAATETNMAYRTADHLRWQQLDFVVGIEIRLSNNHTLNGARFTDICDRLAGRYPKDFKFTGWHPLCRCHAVTVLKTEEEMAEDTRRILAGEQPRSGSENAVADVPAAFRGWVEENEERISAARQRGTLPYFLRDNGKYLAEGRGEPHYGAAMKLGRAATKEAMNVVANLGAPELSEEQKQNIRELADALGIPRKQVKAMSFLEADQGASNPLKDDSNCQSCVVAFSARRRGLDCFAKAYDERNPSKEAFQLGEKFQDGWLNPKTGKPLQPTVLRGRNDGEIIAKLKRTLSQPGEYVLGYNDKNGNGHVMNVINHNGKIIIHDEQANRENNRYREIDSINDIDYLEVIKVDKAILNIDLIKNILFY